MRSHLERKLVRKRGQEGYTLTEMLVVIGIICLIAAVLTPNLLGQLGRSRAKAAQLQLDTMASSVEIFKSDVGRYPTQAEGLKALTQDPGSLTGWTGPYVKSVQSLNDPWNNPIVYKPSPDGQSFYVQSLGADGKPGGTGLAADLRSPAAAP